MHTMIKNLFILSVFCLLSFTQAQAYDPFADQIQTDTASWTGNLSSADNNAQKAFDTINLLPLTGAVWGSITGTLSNQTDLQNALNAKEGTIAAGLTSQYWRGDKSWQTLDTLIVTENTNLYYTTDRVDTWLGGKSTTNLSEGSNLYYTEARVSANTNVSTNTGKVTESTTVSLPLDLSTYNISMPLATSIASGYLSSTDWSTFNGKQPNITWGSGLQYAGTTASVFYNTDNLKITSTRLNTIQDIGTTSTPTFTGTNITGVPAASVLAGTFGTGSYTIDAQLTADTLTDGTLTITGGNLSTTGTGTFGDLVVDTNTLVVNAAGYTDKVGIGTATPNNLFQVTDLLSFTNADYATSIGYQAGKYDLGQYNTYIGYQAGSADNSTGKTDVADRNTGVGYQALYSNTTGNYNSAQGMYALRSNTTGSNNSAQGYEAGKFIADGATGNTIGSNSVFLGYKTKALADGQTNQIVIGSEATGVGSNSVVLGNDSIVTTILKGDVTVPQLIDSGLTASLGVYTDASKQLTSTAPATGDLGFWNKTGTTLIPATSGDGVFINGHVGIGSGSAVPTTSIVNIAETLTATQTHGVEIVPTRLGADNINIAGVWLTPGVSTDADHLFTKSLTGMAGYSIGGGTSFGVGANLIGLSFGNYLGTFGAGGSVNLSTKGIDVFSSWGYAVTATIKNGIGLYVDNIRAPNNYTIEEYACGIYIAPDSSNIASAPQIHQMYIGKPTKATANYQLSLGSYGAGSGVFFDMEAPGTASTPQRIYSDGTNLNVDSPIIMQDKVIFTQTDGNEYIDSLATGYMDYGATTAHRFNNQIDLATDKKLQLRDSAIGIYSQADTFMDLFADGGVRIGNSSAGAPTTYMTIEPDADTFWVGAGSGLPYGDLYVHGNSTGQTISTATLTQVTTFDTAGESNLTTPSVANSDITIIKTGRYFITLSSAFSGDANVTWLGGVYKNNGATQLSNLQTARKLGAGGDVGSVSISGIASLTADDTVEVWFQHAEGVDKSITVQELTLSIVMVGG